MRSRSSASLTVTAPASTGSVGARMAADVMATGQGQSPTRWSRAATPAMVSSMPGPASRQGACQAGSVKGRRSLSPPTKSEAMTANSVNWRNQGVGPSRSMARAPSPAGPTATPIPR